MPHETLWEFGNPTTTSTASTAPTATASSDDPTTAAAAVAVDTAAGSAENIHNAGKCTCAAPGASALGDFRRRQSQQSSLAKYAMVSLGSNHDHKRQGSSDEVDRLRDELGRTLSTTAGVQSHLPTDEHTSDPADAKPVRTTSTDLLQPPTSANATMLSVTGASVAMNDTPQNTAPNSPRLNGYPSSHSSESSPVGAFGFPLSLRQSSGASTPRVRPTTLDIPGLTKSKVSPDGRIAPRDVGSKLVIVMVGLPARGKSYITKKLARYLNWLQHDTRIFNVGERRRVVAGGPHSVERSLSVYSNNGQTSGGGGGIQRSDSMPLMALPESAMGAAQVQAAEITLNGQHLEPPDTPAILEKTCSWTQNGEGGGYGDAGDLHRPDMGEPISPQTTRRRQKDDSIEQNAAFFDPDNQKASQIREQVARETLDELLDFILYANGSVGILDATNSTIERRRMVMDRIRERAGPDLNVLFLESRCVDPDLLEGNMRLKLSGPDYKGMDPTVALEDFRQRVRAYEKAYVPLGEYEERNHMPYIQMIDVGRKIISHQINGFLMAQANYYLLNFNLAPRQIWITRHGVSLDNLSGKIGGNSDLAPEGHQYAKSLTRFMHQKRIEWDEKQLHALRNSHFPPQPGDVTPPNPHYHPQSPANENSPTSPNGSDVYEPKSFCVWTSMLNRSIQTAQYFNDEDYEIKQMRMLDELNAGVMEGLTYSCISSQYPEEYAARKRDKLHYRYPGPGGEGYLDIINRLRPVIVELERMKDHVLLVGHRSVSRVLLAYFRGLGREEVADLDVPLGVLYCLEPKPYGVDFKAYRWDKATEWFYEVPNFKLRRAEDDMQ